MRTLVGGEPSHGKGVGTRSLRSLPAQTVYDSLVRLDTDWKIQYSKGLTKRCASLTSFLTAMRVCAPLARLRGGARRLQQRGSTISASEGSGMWRAARRSERHPTHLLYACGVPRARSDMVWLAAFRRARAGMRDTAAPAAACRRHGLPASQTLPAADEQHGQTECLKGMFCELSPTCQPCDLRKRKVKDC